MVVLPGEDANGAKKFAQRIAYRLQEQPMTWHEDRLVYVTVSIGVACLNAADKSMYFIKHSGRCGIAVYGH